LLIVAVGHKMPAWIDAGFQAYAKRMPPEAKIELTEIKPEKSLGASQTMQNLAGEAKRLEPRLAKAKPLVVLDERGELWDTADVARLISDSMRLGTNPGFVIGGADGLHPQVKQSGDHVLALSRMTLPHGLVRVLLAEQLYRAVSLLHNHPYHRE
jgi:23S rRNA (pseudouridine1915-N3)-methyltransferase